jgi:hypothetical protein
VIFNGILWQVLCNKKKDNQMSSLIIYPLKKLKEHDLGSSLGRSICLPLYVCRCCSLPLRCVCYGHLYTSVGVAQLDRCQSTRYCYSVHINVSLSLIFTKYYSNFADEVAAKFQDLLKKAKVIPILTFQTLT